MDLVEKIRRERLVEINKSPENRHSLESKYGKVWDTEQMCAEFDVVGFLSPFVVVIRKADSQKGSLEFQHMPRFYFNWTQHD